MLKVGQNEVESNRFLKPYRDVKWLNFFNSLVVMDIKSIAIGVKLMSLGVGSKTLLSGGWSTPGENDHV